MPFPAIAPAVGAAAISAGGSILGSLLSGHQNYSNTKKLMAYQNQMNIDNWKMENMYNSPGAQMARLREAGLNPSLVYSSGTDNTGGSIGSSSPASMAGNVDYSQAIPSAVNTYFSAKMQEQQFKNMQFQNDFIKAQINKQYQESVGIALQNARESAFLGSYPKIAALSIAQAEADLRGKSLSNTLYGQQANINDISMTKMAVEIDNLRKTGKSIDASVAQRWSEIAISRALANSNIEVNKETKNKLIQDTANAVRQGNILAYEKTIKQFEAQVAEGKGVLNSNLNKSRNPWEFANDVTTSLYYYLRGY